MKKLNFTKKILLILVISISALFFNSYALIANLNTIAASNYAESNYGSTSVQIKNGKFTSHSSNGKGNPDKVDDWTVADNVIPEKTLSGIISVKEDGYDATKYPVPALSTCPKTLYENDDDFVLVMASLGESTTYGYKSSKIKLEKEKFYAISFHCKTLEDANAFIYTSISKDASHTFQNLKTGGIWKDYYILIATDSFTPFEDFQLELRLGTSSALSTGVVFFDQVEITEIANSDFYNADEITNQNIKKINLDTENYLDSFKNSNFEEKDSIDNSKIIGFTVENDNSDAKTDIKVYSQGDINNKIVTNFNGAANKNYANNNTSINGDNNRELLIMNIDPTKSVVKTNEDNNIKIEQHGFYRLSLLVRTGNLSSDGLDITLTNRTKILSGAETITKTKTGVTSSDGGAYNGWTKVEFFIRGNAWKDCDISLSMALGTDDKKISGWAIIDNIILQQISGEEYFKNSDSNQLDLSKDVPSTSDFTNGMFEIATSTEPGIKYPALPKDWSASTNLTNSGIIRVNEDLFNKDSLKFNYGIYGDDNPGPNSATNPSVPLGNNVFENVLMVRNSTEGDVYFKSNPSSNVTLSANSSTDSSNITKISVGVKTLSNSYAFIQVVSGNDVIASINNISSPNWTTYDIYIRNGLASKTINLQLGTHGDKNLSENNSHYAFFDNVIYKSNDSDFKLADFIDAQNQTDSNNAYKNSIYVDMLENGFYSHSNKVVTGNIYEQNSLLVHQSENVIQYNGIIKSTGENSIGVRKDAIDKNVLVISNTTASSQVLKTIDTYELTENSYYEFSVWIKAVNISGLKDYGIYFEIVNIDDDGNIIENDKNKNKFSNITITEDEENNDWVKYSMFVLAESTQKVKALIGLGYDDNITEGAAYFDDLRIVQIDKNEYSKQKASDTTLVSKVIEVPKENDDNNNNNPSENENNSGINIWALLSSIILVIALILAIIGYAIRRIPKRQIAKIKPSDYEKSPFAVDENEIKRELKLNREQKIVELNKQIEELETIKQETNNKYEEEIKNNENDTEKNKLYAKRTKEINALNKKIDYLQSALTYISDPINIRNEELQIINERKKQSKEEFIKLKQEELEKEQEKLEVQQEETITTTKKKKNKYKNFSKNKSKK